MKKILAALVILIVPNSFAIINNISIYKTKQGDKKIIILGDEYKKGPVLTLAIRAKEAENYRQILRLISQLGACPAPDKTLFYTFYGYIAVEPLKKDRAGDLVYLRPRLALFAQKNNFKVQNINLRLDHNVDEHMGKFIGFINYCSKYIAKYKQAENPQVLKKYSTLQQKSRKNYYTFDEFFENIKRVIASKQEKLSKLEYGFIWIFLLEQVLNKNKEVFKEYDFTRPYIEVIIEKIHYSQGDIVAELINLVNSVSAIYDWLTKVDYFISFFGQEDSNYNTFIYCIDAEDAIEFDKYLTGMYGLELVSQGGFTSTLSIQKIEEILNLDQQSKSLTSEQLEEQIGARPAVKLNINNCAYCNKHDSVNICGKCQAVRYCSPKCQKADWSRHKLNCKTIESKKK